MILRKVALTCFPHTLYLWGKTYKFQNPQKHIKDGGREEGKLEYPVA